MTRTYAARRLLEHGPLTPSEFRVITGWPSRIATDTLHRLKRNEELRRFNAAGRTFYELRSGA